MKMKKFNVVELKDGSSVTVYNEHLKNAYGVTNYKLGVDGE